MKSKRTPNWPISPQGLNTKFYAQKFIFTHFLVVPVDLEKQEEEKTERKRERNRIAATKCRKRKIQRINVLEDEVN